MVTLVPQKRLHGRVLILAIVRIILKALGIKMLLFADEAGRHLPAHALLAETCGYCKINDEDEKDADCLPGKSFVSTD